jgi:hypothetical protein
MTINYLPITTWDAFQVIVANWENNANECMYGLVELLNNFIGFVIRLIEKLQKSTFESPNKRSYWTRNI